MKLTVTQGRDRTGRAESFGSVSLASGELWAVVGPTGSGKSRLVKDIEMLVSGDSVTGRTVLLDGRTISGSERQQLTSSLIAHLGQNMRFVLDMPIGEFLSLHARSAGVALPDMDEIIGIANRITEEPVAEDMLLSSLSGGQSRALMCADIACISDRPIVLIDEIENAGIDKEAALNVLAGRDKLVLIVTHDPHTALMADGRIVLSSGGIHSIRRRSEAERSTFLKLDSEYRAGRRLQQLLRSGGEVV